MMIYKIIFFEKDDIFLFILLFISIYCFDLIFIYFFAMLILLAYYAFAIYASCFIWRDARCHAAIDTTSRQLARCCAPLLVSFTILFAAGMMPPFIAPLSRHADCRYFTQAARLLAQQDADFFDASPDYLSTFP